MYIFRKNHSKIFHYSYKNYLREKMKIHFILTFILIVLCTIQIDAFCLHGGGGISKGYNVCSKCSEKFLRPKPLFKFEPLKQCGCGGFGKDKFSFDEYNGFKSIGGDHCSCGNSIVKSAFPPPLFKNKNHKLEAEFNKNTKESSHKKCSCGGGGDGEKIKHAPEKYQHESSHKKCSCGGGGDASIKDTPAEKYQQESFLSDAIIYSTTKDDDNKNNQNNKEIKYKYPADPVSLGLAYQQAKHSTISIPEESLQFGFRKTPQIVNNQNDKYTNTINEERLWAVDQPIIELKRIVEENGKDLKNNKYNNNNGKNNKHEIKQNEPNYLGYNDIGYYPAERLNNKFIKIENKIKGEKKVELKQYKEDLKTTKNVESKGCCGGDIGGKDSDRKTDEIILNVNDNNMDYKDNQIKTIEMDSEEFYNSPYFKELSSQVNFK